MQLSIKNTLRNVAYLVPLIALLVTAELHAVTKISGTVGPSDINDDVELSADVTLIGNLVVRGKLDIKSYKLTLNGFTLSLYGDFTKGAGSAVNTTSTSRLEILGTLTTELDKMPITEIGDLIVNRPGGSIKIDKNLIIHGQLAVLGGNLNTNNKVITINGTLIRGNGTFSNTASLGYGPLSTLRYVKDSTGVAPSTAYEMPANTTPTHLIIDCNHTYQIPVSKSFTSVQILNGGLDISATGIALEITSGGSISVGSNGQLNLSNGGSLVMDPTAIMEYSGGQLPASLAAVSNLTIPSNTSATVQTNSDLTVNGTLSIAAGKKLKIGANKKLVVNGPLALNATGSVEGGSDCSLELGESFVNSFTSSGTESMPSIVGGLKDLTINRDVTLQNDLTLTGSLLVKNSGIFRLNGKHLTVSNDVDVSGTSALIVGGAGSSITLTGGSGKSTLHGMLDGIDILNINKDVDLATNLEVIGQLNLSAGSTLDIQNNILTFRGTFTANTGTITTTSNTNSTFNIYSPSGTTTDITLPAVANVAYVTIDRPGSTMSLSSDLTMKGNLTVTSGTLNLGSNNIILKGVLTVGQDGQITGTGSVIPRQNNGKSKLVNAKLKKLVLDDGDADVEGTLTIGDQGSIDFSSPTAGNVVLLSDAVIDLGTTGTIIGETSTKRVTGSGLSKIRSQRSLSANNMVNFGNGVSINPLGNSNLGAGVVADRTFSVATANNASSIARRFVFTGLGTPTTNMQVVFTYGEDELTGVVNDESRLGVFASTNDGASWYEPLSQIRDVNNNTITVTFTSNFSKASRLPSFGKGAGIASTQEIPPLILTGGEAGGALPVELVSFSGLMRNEKVQLAWKTATETNNYGFEVERAAVVDPKASVENAQWSTIGFVAGNGTTSSERSYMFSDDVSAGVLQQVAHFAYRLRQIDRDGTTDYSPVVFVSRSAQEPVALALDMPYPNPTSSESFATVRLAESRIATVQLVSVDGKVLDTIAADQQLDAGVHNFRISRGTLPAGVYFVVVQSADLRVVRPLTIVR